MNSFHYHDNYINQLRLGKGEERWVPVGEAIEYDCATKGHVVNDTSLSLISVCGADGQFEDIEAWPICRTAQKCKEFLEPRQNETFLTPTSSKEVFELDYAFYTCQDGATLKEVEDNDDVINNRFR